VAQVIEHLPRKQVLSSKPSTTKIKKKKCLGYRIRINSVSYRDQFDIPEEIP
jgi:hypothetical protein